MYAELLLFILSKVKKELAFASDSFSRGVDLSFTLSSSLGERLFDYYFFLG